MVGSQKLRAHTIEERQKKREWKMAKNQEQTKPNQKYLFFSAIGVYTAPRVKGPEGLNVFSQGQILSCQQEKLERKEERSRGGRSERHYFRVKEICLLPPLRGGACDFLPYTQCPADSVSIHLHKLCHSIKRVTSTSLPSTFAPSARGRLDNSSQSKKFNKHHSICRKASVLIKNLLYHAQIQAIAEGLLFSGVLLLWVQENTPVCSKSPPNLLRFPSSVYFV